MPGDQCGYNASCGPSVTDPTVVTFTIVRTYSAKTRKLLSVAYVCPDPETGIGPPPLPTAAAISAEVTRRAPVPVTLAGGTDYLVRAAIVFYMTGPNAQPVTAVTIPHIPLGGYNLTAKLSLAKTVWRWGDGTSTTVTTGSLTGQPYTDRIPCESATECRHYISHVYATPANRTVTVQAFWHVTVTVDGTGENIPIAGDVYRSDPTGKDITLHRAHAILVPNR